MRIQTKLGHQENAGGNLGTTAFDLVPAVTNPIGAGGWLVWLSAINAQAGLVFLKFYDKSAANVNAAVDVPILTVAIQGGVGQPLFLGNVETDEEGRVTYGLLLFYVALSVRVCQGLASTDATAATTQPTIDYAYAVATSP